MKKILIMTLIAGLGLSGLTGCNDGAKKGAETDFQYSQNSVPAARIWLDLDGVFSPTIRV